LLPLSKNYFLIKHNNTSADAFLQLKQYPIKILPVSSSVDCLISYHLEYTQGWGDSLPIKYQKQGFNPASLNICITLPYLH
jgi:hypothetical protein